MAPVSLLTRRSEAVSTSRSPQVIPSGIHPPR